MEEKVVLVDENCCELGLMGKTEAHEKGILHKAISVNIFNSKGEMLIQQRAYSKYHWAGIWSNTCCSHPRENESFQVAAERRLFEELGIKTELKNEFYFIYKAKDEKSGLTEHEYDTVFTGIFDDDLEINKLEINAVAWVKINELQNDMLENPDKYSFWFKTILNEMKIRKII